MRISIVGSGAVGQAVGRGLMALGNEVVFFDIDAERVRGLRGLGLDATDDMNRAVQGSDISFVCVPTPTKGGAIDLGPFKAAIGDLASALRAKGAIIW
ncbi:MAG: NAD(P)-binding domain-containing protein [Candidatus Bathyarchaeia archaeon]